MSDVELVDALRRVANLALWCCLAGEPEPQRESDDREPDDDHHV